jgi:peptidoglycan/xylan/chitin deacetylase (PgdA/CDA1 family)
MPTPRLIKAPLLAAVTRSGAHRLFSSGLRNRALVLKYHHIVAQDAQPWFDFESSVQENVFRTQMAAVSKLCRTDPFESLLDDDVESSLGSKKPRVVITFDDGYEDNYKLAFPILQEFGLTATFFIATGYVGTHLTYPKNRVKALFRADPRQTERLAADAQGIVRDSAESDERYVSRLGDGMVDSLTPPEWNSLLEQWESLIGTSAMEHDMFRVMGRDQIRELRAADHSIGGHTVYHRRLKGLDRESVLAEVRQGRLQLEKHVGESVRSFAYPDGRLDPTSLDVVREEFRLACTSASGFDRLPLSDPHLISRASPPPGQNAFEALISGLSPWWGSVRARVRGR